ncbi:MAG: hypothetical protein U1G05_03950 [Kiritimatiellia bacterium]
MNLPRSPHLWVPAWILTAGLAFWAGRGSAPMVSATVQPEISPPSAGDGPARRVLRPDRRRRGPARGDPHQHQFRRRP